MPTRNPLVIGLTGRKLSGKDTFCEALQTSARPGVRVVRLAFGDFLKDEVAEACGVMVEEINRDKAAFRSILQWWGTDLRRNRCGDDYWVGRMRRALFFESLHANTVAVLTDVRFPNEAEPVREHGGMLVRLVRPEAETPDPHASETAMDGYPVDHTILNDGCRSALDEVADLFWRWCSTINNLQ